MTKATSRSQVVAPPPAPDANGDKKAQYLYYLRLCAPDLPEPDQEEFKFAKPRKWSADYAYFGHGRGLLIEVDGGQYAYRGGRHATDDDRHKLNRAAALGYLVIRISPTMLRDAPDLVLRDVRTALINIGRIE